MTFKNMQTDLNFLDNTNEAFQKVIRIKRHFGKYFISVKHFIKITQLVENNDKWHYLHHDSKHAKIKHKSL